MNKVAARDVTINKLNEQLKKAKTAGSTANKAKGKSKSKLYKCYNCLIVVEKDGKLVKIARRATARVVTGGLASRAPRSRKEPT